MKKIAVVGGGTGTFVVLSGLKKYPLDLSVIVSMMDSGGSTGRLRDQLGVLPPGDLRQCLVALSEAPELWRKLFLYRFENGDLEGHNFGNIFITVLEKILGDYQKVVDTASFILRARGKVLPVTFDKTHLCVKYEDGEVIEREAAIDRADHKSQRIVKAYLKPAAKLNPQVLETISQCDYLVIGPGDLYTSLIPNLLVDGMAEAIKNSSAKIIMVMNLMTKMGQTARYSASDHLYDLEKYLRRKIDMIILNDKKIDDGIVSYYARSGERPVGDNLENIKDERSVIYADLISEKKHTQSNNDRAVRSLLRHDSDKTAAVIWKYAR